MNRLPLRMIPLLLAPSMTPLALAQVPKPADAERELRPSTVKRRAIGDRGAWENNLWPGGVVPFLWDPNVTLANQAAMAQAMIQLSRVANITFVPRTNQTDYLYIYDGFGNSSYVGRIGGPQEVEIYNWNYKYIMCHELMHAVGAEHEQSRSDRDQYIIVHYENISNECGGSCAYNFDIEPTAALTGPYDFESIMHYDRFAFSRNGLPTISAKPGYEQFNGVMGQLDHLSAGDVAGLATRYPTPWQKFSKTLYARSVSTSTDWMDESEATGAPSGGCNASPDQFAYNDTAGSAQWLTATDFDAYSIPIGHVVTGVRADVYCRYDDNSTGNDVYYRVNSNPRITSPRWNQTSTACNWRLANADVTRFIPRWTNDTALVNALTLGVQWGHSSDPVGANRLRVNSFRLIIETELDSDGDSTPDSLDPDRDGDGVPNDTDCAADDGARWRSGAYPDADGDGIRDSVALVGTPCFGTTPPSGFTLAANGPDNCAAVANSSQANCDGDALGDACDALSAPRLVSGPSSGRVCRTGVIQLGLQASSDAPLAYRWFRNGAALAADARVSGVTSSVLRITSARISDSGIYTCQASSSCGTIVSSGASILVCASDFNCDGALSVQDVFDFFTAYFAMDPRANLNGGGLSVQDIFDFLAAYFAGC